jgi:hypothetical protein
MRPITKPIIITVEDMASMFDLFHNCKARERRKQNPHMKASFDKNNSQRMGDFRVK